MLKNISRIIFILTILFASDLIYSQSIKGKITDAGNSEPLVGATVKVTGKPLGALADLDGNYEITDIDPGVYTMEFSYIGYTPKTLKDIVVTAGNTANINVSLTLDGLITDEIVV